MANTQPNQFIIDEEEADYEHRLNAILIDEDRYHGAYSHHGYTAWLNRIPSDISAGDTTCGEFWRQNTLIFGGGNTPDEAAADLIEKIGGTDFELGAYLPKFIYNTGVFTKIAEDKRFIAIIHPYQHLAENYPLTYAAFKKIGWV